MATSTRFVQATALVAIFALLHFGNAFSPNHSEPLGVIAGLGFLLLAGTLLSELLETIHLPHLSGYLIAGILAGPHVGHLIDHDTVERMSQINTLALTLIALAGGAELRLDVLARVARSVTWSLTMQSFVGLVILTLTFILLAPFIPFAKDLGYSAIIGIALLWGVLGVSRSPSACLGILSQTRAKGPLADFSLAFIMVSDVLIVTMMACALLVAKPLVLGAAEFSFADFGALGHELVGSVAMGTTIGLLLILYLRFVGHSLLVVLLGLGFGMTEFMRYVHIDPLLSFIAAGFVVQNLSDQGHKLLHSVEQIGGIVFVVFFATAGAHLDLPLLKQLWPIAVTFFAVRAFTAVGINKWLGRADDPPVIRRWGWASMVSQAGLTLGLSVVVARAFPEFGEGFRALAIATVALNEMVGPVLFKLALDRSGESAQEEPMSRRMSVAPEPP